MFLTYLRRELTIRRRQTIVVVIGMALAIGLVIMLNAAAAGVRDAQAQALQSVYGVGTDITVTQTAQPGQGGGPQRFEFGSAAGASGGTDSQQLSNSRLGTGRGSTAFASTTLTTVSGIDHVESASAVLSLENITFNGEIPDFSAGPPSGGRPPSGGADGAGGSAFDVDQFSVLGVDPTATAVGPLTAVAVAQGRGLSGDDATANVAVIDTVYASSNEVAVGDTLSVGGTDVQVVGIVESSTGTGVTTGTDVFLPLQTAQTLSSLTDQISDIYVQADSSANIDAIDKAVEAALPDMTVSTQADLAQSVTGSLSTASNLITGAGRWLSLVALGAAFLLAILFTISGVGRRTRELGTLKAIGWGNPRVVGQVAGESVTTGLIGGVVGIVVGMVGVLAINAAGITLTGSAAAASTVPGGPPGAFRGGPPMNAAVDAAGQAAQIVLRATLNPAVIASAVALAILGGLLAGAFGGRRAARLSPAEALRSVA